MSNFNDDLFTHNSKEHSYAKMMIESNDTLSKSEAIAFLKQASTTESKLSLLDAMKDKINFSTEEINEFVPSSDSSCFNLSNTSSFDKLSYLSLCVPQTQSRHMLASHNNAAQPSTNKKRSSLFRNLFKRRPSKKKKKIIVGKRVEKRTISGGDHVKLSSANRINHSEHHYQNTMETKQKSSKLDNSIPFASQLSFQQDQSLSSLSDPTSIRQYFHEQTQRIHDIPQLISKNVLAEKVSFNMDPYQYKTTTTTNHQYPKCVSAVEKLAKQYSSSTSQSDGTGLLWFNANHQLINGTMVFPNSVDVYKSKCQSDSSSNSRDTSTSSNSSSNSNSTKAKTNQSSSSSSSSSSSTTTTSSSSSSNSTTSSSQSKRSMTTTIGQYNRNQNDRDHIIHIDFNSVTSRTSTSTSTSIQPCYQRSVARKQSSTTTTTTNSNKYFSQDTTSSDRIDSRTYQTTGKFKVKRQRLEQNLLN